MLKHCVNCGKTFKPKCNRQIYCSCECRRADYYARGKLHKDNGNTAIRDFYCRQCQRHIFIFDYSDQRTVFCSAFCEKKYWRVVTKHKNRGRNGNLGMSGGMSLGSLIRREARDLRD